MPKKKVFPMEAVPYPLGNSGVFQPCPIITDPQGSYTGKPLEQWDMPVQDADDL